MGASTAEITGDGSLVRDFGGPLGFGDWHLDRSDDGWAAVDVSAAFPDGFRIGGTVYPATAFFVNTNGNVSLGHPLELSSHGDLPFADMAVIAPFWADVDTRLSGEGAESGQVWVHVDAERGIVTVTWYEVGVYRFNAEQTNAFQLQLIHRGGGDFDIVYRYERIEWTTGDMVGSSHAWAGLAHAEDALFQLPASGLPEDLLQLDAVPGNTGVVGLWVYHIRDGQLAEGGTSDPPPPPPPDAGEVIEGTAGDDTLLGGSGDDTLMGSAGADLMDGGGGRNIVDYRNAPDGVVASLADSSINAGWAAGDSYVSIHDLFGSNYDDELHGDSGDNFINGGPGNDTIHGHGGNNVLVGGMGDDLIFGGPGDDVINGGPGHDTLYGGEGDDRLRGGGGRDLLYGGPGNDLLIGDAGNDTLHGGPGNDKLFGGMGNDLLVSGPGRNLLNGGPGDDTLIGGGNVDTLRGGSGNDVLTGGGGADIFVFRAGYDNNIITDFELGLDRLFLNTDLWPGDLTPDQVLSQFGSVQGEDFILDFGPGGTVIILQGIGAEGFAQLADDILITG
jgi:serralysin